MRATDERVKRKQKINLVTTMIEIKDLHYNYAGSKYNVFDGLSVELDNNSIYGLLGRNGPERVHCSILLPACSNPRAEAFLQMEWRLGRGIPRCCESFIWCPKSLNYLLFR